MAETAADRIAAYLRTRGRAGFEEVCQKALGMANARGRLAERLVRAAAEGDERLCVGADAVRLALDRPEAASADDELCAVALLAVPLGTGGRAPGEAAAVWFGPSGVTRERSCLVRVGGAFASRALAEAGVEEAERRAAVACDAVGSVLGVRGPLVLTADDSGMASRLFGSCSVLPLQRLARAALGPGRWSLERVAAHLGIALPEPRRAARTARAIAQAAGELISLLPRGEGLGRGVWNAAALSETVERLARAQTPATHLADEAVLQSLPGRPGVYILRDAAGAVVYVGKAANLRVRVRSHFGAGGAEEDKRAAIRETVRDVEWEECGSELAALVREAELIAEHDPALNRQREVHARRHPFVRHRAVVFVLPSAIEGMLDVIIVERARRARICRLTKGGRVPAAAKAAIRRCFRPETRAAPRGPSPAAEIAASWMERHRERVDYIVIDEQENADAALRALERLVRERRGG